MSALLNVRGYLQLQQLKVQLLARLVLEDHKQRRLWHGKRARGSDGWIGGRDGRTGHVGDKVEDSPDETLLNLHVEFLHEERDVGVKRHTSRR